MGGSLQRAWGLAAALAVAQAALAARIGLGDDEAFYWTWTQAPERVPVGPFVFG